MTIRRENPRGSRRAGLGLFAVMTTFALGVSLFAPASAGAARLFFDGFEGGGFGPMWSGFTLDTNQGHAFWEVQPASAGAPVRTGNYSMTNSNNQVLSDYWCVAMLGPLNLTGKRDPRLEFDLYRNMNWPVPDVLTHPTRLSLFAKDACDTRPTSLSDFMEKVGGYTGATRAWEHVSIPLNSWPTMLYDYGVRGDVLRYMPLGTMDPPVYIAFSYDSDHLAGVGEGVYIDNVAITYSSAVTLLRSPSKSSITVKRKKGVARYTLGVVARDEEGNPLSGQVVLLQTSKNGKTNWKSAYATTADDSGKVSKTFTSRKKGTAYFRWTSSGAAATAKQKVVVK